MTQIATDLPPKAAEFARTLRKHMPELGREYGVASLALFGSYVRGEEREDSDLDVLVGFSVTPSLLDLARLRRTLSTYLKINVDLSPKDGLRERVGAQILQEAVEV